MAAAAADVLTYRESLISDGITLGGMYDALRTPGKDRLADLHGALDDAVHAAYHLPSTDDPMTELLGLNLELSALELDGHAVRGPGPAYPDSLHRTALKIKAPSLDETNPVIALARPRASSGALAGGTELQVADETE